MTFLKKKGILLITLSLFGCADGLDPFPAKDVWVIMPETKQCSKHKIIKQDPVTVDKGEYVAWDVCPHVMGFRSDETGSVFKWIREAQRQAKVRCK